MVNYSNTTLSHPRPSTTESRHNHAVCTLQVHQPTSPVPPFLLVQNLFPKCIILW